MGDAVLGLSAVQFLKEIFPESTIDYATPAWMSSLFEDESSIHASIPLDFKNLGAWIRTFFKLKKHSYDVILEFNQAGRSGNFFKLYANLFGIPYYYHNHNLKTGEFVIDQGKRKPNIQRDLDLVYSYATKILSLKVNYPQYINYEPQFHQPASQRKNILVLGTVATRQTKMWPSEYWVQFVGQFLRFNPDWKVIIPMSNNELDQKIKKDLMSLQNFSQVQFLETDLRSLKKTLTQAMLYVGNDTGLKHLCIALGLKSLSFFGPEEPLEWHPYDTKRHPYYFVEPLECRTITSHYCGLNECSVMACLKTFTPENVVQRSISLMN